MAAEPPVLPGHRRQLERLARAGPGPAASRSRRRGYRARLPAGPARPPGRDLPGLDPDFNPVAEPIAGGRQGRDLIFERSRLSSCRRSSSVWCTPSSAITLRWASAALASAALVALRDIRHRSTLITAATTPAAEMIATISATTARQESSWPSCLARLFVSVVLHVDFLPQRVERVVSAGLDGTQWHAEGFGGLGRRCAAEVTLEEHLTVLGRQRP